MIVRPEYERPAEDSRSASTSAAGGPLAAQRRDVGADRRDGALFRAPTHCCMATNTSSSADQRAHQLLAQAAHNEFLEGAQWLAHALRRGMSPHRVQRLGGRSRASARSSRASKPAMRAPRDHARISRFQNQFCRSGNRKT
jgi:hypothetical protein